MWLWVLAYKGLKKKEKSIWLFPKVVMVAYESSPLPELLIKPGVLQPEVFQPGL